MRWTVPTTVIHVLQLMAPLQESPEIREMGRAFTTRIRDSYRQAAFGLEHQGLDWALARHTYIPPSLASPDGKELPSAASFIRYTKGRPRWSKSKIRRKLRERFGSAPSIGTLDEALRILAQSGAIRLLEDCPRYVFVRIPTGEELVAVSTFRKKLRLDEADDRNETIARALKDVARYAEKSLPPR